mmetsp:Transcript_43531/g.105540  ORF Transcript_43531/g.105540 Transcript_43531/m.105540 type:complete len:94 (+) Transcript_43531:161-442(+)
MNSTNTASSLPYPFVSLLLWLSLADRGGGAAPTPFLALDNNNVMCDVTLAVPIKTTLSFFIHATPSSCFYFPTINEPLRNHLSISTLVCLLAL